MQKVFDFLKTHKKSSIGAGAILILIALLVGGKGKSQAQIFVVERGNVEQSVILAGGVTTTDKADLGFAASGRLGRIFVNNNQEVKEGAILAQLEIGDLFAELKIKQANLKMSEVDLSAAKDELEDVTSREDTKVDSALKTLHSEDLEVIPNSSNYSAEAPEVNGSYNGPAGSYKIIIEKENITLSDFTIRTFDLEKTEGLVNEEGKTPLGTRGLFLSFPDDLSSYDDTIWFLDIPNKSGDSYTANLNAYEEAKDTRDIAVKEAQAKYDKLLAGENSSELSIAQAEIQKINSEIRKNTIYAPFPGKVTNIEKEIGESVSVAETVVSMLSEERLEVVLEVPEIDVSKLVVGEAVKIALDAFPGEFFTGVLRNINSKETEIDGVPVYEAFVELTADPRIKTGMSAKGEIVLDRKENVLVIPAYTVEKVGGKDFVKVINDKGDTEKREVTLGLQGTNSMVEVLSGLTEGEKVLGIEKTK